ncbi:ABC transporter permease [Paenarthrobacter sp. NPDC057981]|uniref:ABC transporter permease n=1 Tax=Paenarthrobacter sp. NPDC057981 TaxID=3346297 RepID=UPI0036D881A0
MVRFLAKRLFNGVLLIFVVTAVVFFLMYSTGSSIARNILGQGATQEKVDALTVSLGLNRPLVEQYWTWLVGAVQGNLGKSFFTGEPITNALASRLPITFSVVLVALLLTLVISTALGIAAAARGGWLDRAIQSTVTVSYVFPVIIFAIGMVYLFAVTLKWVPAIGFVSFARSPIGWFASIILPSITLAFGGIASLAAQIRGSMIDELERDYVRTLRSRGITSASILFKHALRNAASPALTTFSLLFIGLFGASFFIEKVFALPGYGSFALNASIQGDPPAMLGVTLFSIVLVVVVNMVIDIIQGLLNPKVRI